MSIKVLVLTSTFPRWPDDVTPSFVMELSRRLAEEGLSVHVLAPHGKGAKREEVIDGLVIYRFKYFFNNFQLLNYDGGILANIRNKKWLILLIPFFLMSQSYSLYKLLNKNDYDLIHAHWIIPQGLIALLVSRISNNRKVKILCTSHGGDLFAFQNAPFFQLKKWVLDSTSAVTVVSTYMKKICETMVSKKGKIHVCSMGVDLENAFKPLNNEKKNRNKLIFVGRLVEKKGVAILLEAISKLVERKLNLELDIVGDGPERKKLEDLCNDLNIQHCVKFLGSKSPRMLPEIYASSSIAVMPSIVDSQNDQEGLGLVAIEAMGCNCAVVASSLPAVRDIIEDGVNGILCRPGDIDDLANSLEKVLLNSNLREQISSAARPSVLNKYDWKIITNKYRELIFSICT